MSICRPRQVRFGKDIVLAENIIAYFSVFVKNSCRMLFECGSGAGRGHAFQLAQLFANFSQIFLTFFQKGIDKRSGLCYNSRVARTWPHSQAAKTSPSHGEGVGSIPAGVTKTKQHGLRPCCFVLVTPGGLEKRHFKLRIFLFGECKPAEKHLQRRVTNAPGSLLPSFARRGSDSRDSMVFDHAVSF